MSTAHRPTPPVCPCSLCAPAGAPSLLVCAGEFRPETALAVAAAESSARRRCRFLLPAWCGGHASLNESAIYLDSPPRHRAANVRPLREAIRWMRSGGVLVVFGGAGADAAPLDRLARLGRRPARAPLRLVPRMPALAMS